MGTVHWKDTHLRFAKVRFERQGGDIDHNVCYGTIVIPYLSNTVHYCSDIRVDMIKNH